MFSRIKSKLFKRSSRFPRKKVKKNGFWFIDIPRTSSSSIRTELANTFGSTYGKSNLLENEFEVNGSYKDHLTASQAMKHISPRDWEQLFTFTIVRNPWDRMVSLYFYRAKKGQIPTGLSFKDYISQLKSPRYNCSNSMHYRPSYYYGAAEFILDKKENVIVDYIGKFEERESSLKYISKRINCPTLGKLCLQKAKPSEKHYSMLYDKECRELVSKVYARDIELFGYEFEEA